MKKKTKKRLTTLHKSVATMAEGLKQLVKLEEDNRKDIDRALSEVEYLRGILFGVAAVAAVCGIVSAVVLYLR